MILNQYMIYHRMSIGRASILFNINRYLEAIVKDPFLSKSYASCY